MDYEWDELKRQSNLLKHGVDFSLSEEFDWDTAWIEPDRRRAYGENRWIAIGWLGERLHVLVFAERGGSVRIIGLRKANLREGKQYEKAQT